MDPFTQAFEIMQEIELQKEGTIFLPKYITNAVKNGDLKKINTFNVEQLNSKSNVYSPSGKPLIFDALYGFRSCEVLQIMINKGVNVNCVDSGFPNRSPLMQAVISGRFEEIKILVEAGADLSFNGNWNDGDMPQTIIGNALFRKRYDVVEYLKEKGAKYLPNEETIIKKYHSENKW